MSVISTTSGIEFKRMNWKEREDTFKMIKDMMRSSHKYAPVCTKQAKKAEKEIRQAFCSDSWVTRNFIESRILSELVSIYDRYDGENSYYIVYKDGSEVCITDVDLVSGERMPKLTNVAYMYYSGPCDECDTEIGQWSFDLDDEKEMELRNEYETAIQKKFNTEWYQRWYQN